MPVNAPVLKDLLPPVARWDQERAPLSNDRHWESTLVTVPLAEGAGLMEATLARLTADAAAPRGGGLVLARWETATTAVLGVFEQGQAHRGSDALEAAADAIRDRLPRLGLNMAWNLTAKDIWAMAPDAVVQALLGKTRPQPRARPTLRPH
jgi:hypothetical protein